MKKLLTLLLVLTLALPGMALAEDSVPASTLTPAVQTAKAAQGATITVTGAAAVTMKADYAQVTVGVSTVKPTVAEASEINNAAIRSVIDALKNAGIPEEDIATRNYSVSAEYDYSSFGGSKLTGYQVSNQLTVIIRDMEHIGATLDKATAAGANSIYNIEFLSTQADAAQDEATVHAVQDAMRKAKLLAAASGLTLGDVISLEESTVFHSVSARTYDMKAAAPASSNVILPDDTGVSASVTMVFELK